MLVFLAGYPQAGAAHVTRESIQVRKIWGNGYHNAFTSLLYFDKHFYCSFRQGSGHVGGDDGVVQIIRSKDRVNWESIAVLQKDGYDLRDPKLSVTPDGRIMVIIGGSVYENRNLVSRLPHVSFSNRSGTSFSHPQPVSVDSRIKTETDWLWRVTWHGKTGYGVIYRLPRKISLVKTTDGINYELVKDFEEVHQDPNETTVRFAPDGEMFMMVRRRTGKGLWGRSLPPYQDWNWTDTGIDFGGPDFEIIRDGLFIAGTRVYEKPVYTGIYLADKKGKFRKIFRLPSGGDNSYPGFVVAKDRIYMSYYSSHEGNSSVYLAEIPISVIDEALSPPPVIESGMIWDQAPHNAFTDLARFKGKFYCVFREGGSHVSGNDGSVRVLASDTGKEWASVALVREEGIDLRDPKLSVNPDGRLMIMCGGSKYEGKAVREWHTRVLFSENGADWTPPMRITGVPSNNWAFGITWKSDTGFIAPRICRTDPQTGQVDQTGTQIRVYKTSDGLNYEPVSEDIAANNFECGKGCGETSIRFRDDGSMVILARLPGKGKFLFGVPPYVREFTTVDIDHGMGGQVFLPLENGYWLIGTREYANERPGNRAGTATVLLVADDNGIYKRVAELPSGGDTAYPGMLKYNGELWMSYYSSHEGKSAVYISRIPLAGLQPR